MMERIERTALSNLIHNEEYTRKVLPFIKEEYFADVVMFDANKVDDSATFDEPLQFSTGVAHVVVNGTPVLLNSKHTNKFTGRYVKGPGYIEQ